MYSVYIKFAIKKKKKHHIFQIPRGNSDGEMYGCSVSMATE